MATLSIHWLTPHANIVTDDSGCSPALDAARYACGWIEPNYPVPAIRYNVVNYASGDCIEIRSWKGSFDKPLIDKVYWKPV